MSRRSIDAAEIAAVAARWVARRDAGLSAEEQAEFERWLTADARHSPALAHFSEVLSVFDRPRRSDVAAVVIREMDARARRLRRHRLQAASAAATLVAIVVSIGLWSGSHRVGPITGQLPAGAVAYQPERRVLPDGSIVELRDGAKIAVNLSPSLRQIELQLGEAHFQVAKDAGRPFIVKAGGIEVRAVGTAFSVQLGSRAVEVLVTEGRVALDTPAERPASASHALPASTSEKTEPLASKRRASPLDGLNIDAGNRVVVEVTPQTMIAPIVLAVSIDEVAERLAWRNPRLEFSGTPLREAVALMNRSIGAQTDSTRLRLVIDPASRTLMEERVSGTFRADNPALFARMLEKSLGVQVERRGTNEIVLRK